MTRVRKRTAGASGRHAAAWLTGLSLLCVAAAPDQPADFARVKRRVRAEPEPEEITRGKHFINSDERRHDLFYEAISGRGGLFIGVGSHQNYMLAGWAEPEAMIVVDFDQVIIDLHRVFEVVFRNTDSPEQFLEAWKPQSRRQVVRWIRAAYRDKEERLVVKETFLEYRPNMVWGMNQAMARMKEQGRSTFMDDAKQFATVKRLFTDNRVLFVRGDFTGRQTFRDIARVAKRSGLDVGVLYLSNIEQYFAWSSRRYRKNMLDLPFDENTIVLRAYGFGNETTADQNYHYYVQPGLGFHSWLRNKTRSVRTLLESAQPTEITGFHRLNLPPDVAAKNVERSPASSPKSG